VYLRLVGAEHDQIWESRGHFFAAAAQAMRRILIENARRDRSLKRGGTVRRIEQDLDAIAEAESQFDLLALHEALNRLAARDQRKAQLVELRFFSGLTMQQAADVMGISVASAQRDWAYARAWLHREIAGDGSPAE
jgi:RNA polymerase sigma factor (TIGR02999 family)